MTMAVITPGMLARAAAAPRAAAARAVARASGSRRRLPSGQPVGERVARRPRRHSTPARNPLRPRRRAPGWPACRSSSTSRVPGFSIQRSTSSVSSTEAAGLVVRAAGGLGGARQAGARVGAPAAARRRPATGRPRRTTDSCQPPRRPARAATSSGDGGQRLQPLHRRSGADAGTASGRAAPRRPRSRSSAASRSTRAEQRRDQRAGSPVDRRRGSRRRCAAYSSTGSARRCTARRSGPCRPARRRVPGAAQGQPVGALAQRQRLVDGGDRGVGGRAGRGTGRGRRRRPARTRRTTDSRGNGSSVSRTHSARSGNRERRL